MNDLKNKTLFVSGASRGIGLAIAKRAAKDGANIILAAKQLSLILNFQVLFIPLQMKLLKRAVKHYL